MAMGGGMQKTVLLVTMRKLLLLLVLTVLAGWARAQRVYFLYLQTENGGPFYVRMSDKVHSSTAAGYLILSNLRDSTYLLHVGFPGQTAETSFRVPVNRADRGFLLKKVERGWTLFDLQELTLLKALANAGPSADENQRLLAQADPFTRLLVQASDDYTLLHSGPSAPSAQREQEASSVVSLPGTMAGAPSTGAPIPGGLPVAAPPAATEPVPQVAAPGLSRMGGPGQDTVPAARATAYQRSQVIRSFEGATGEGLGLVFLDQRGDGVDTIHILIPDQNKELVTGTGVGETSTVASAAVQPSRSLGESAPALAKVETTVPAGCSQMAGTAEMERLHRQVDGGGDDAAKVSVIRKALRRYCFRTEQVQGLLVKLQSTIARYNLLEAAWGRVSDPSGFEALGHELKDEYYQRRFKALIAQ